LQTDFDRRSALWYHEPMGLTRLERIPLFPLNVVLLPGAALPLHIFEPRYRQMIRKCLDNKTEFGLLLSLPMGIVRVGCSAEIIDVVKRYNDGRMDIITVGRSPFRIVELLNPEAFAEEGLLEGQVDYLDDHERPVCPKVRRELIELYEVCHTIIFDDYPRSIQNVVPEDLSYIVAGTLPMDLMWKQQVLELRSEADRQERLVTYLREWAPHLHKEETQRHHSEGNAPSLN
jgi:ATP-dependent Lon protease